MVVIALVMVAFGSVLAAPLYSTSVDIFSTFHRYQR
jgi:hypothetical protein